MRATPAFSEQPRRERPAGHLDLPCRAGRANRKQEAAERLIRSLVRSGSSASAAEDEVLRLPVGMVFLVLQVDLDGVGSGGALGREQHLGA
jgi:hypothetical protein